MRAGYGRMQMFSINKSFGIIKVRYKRLFIRCTDANVFLTSYIESCQVPKTGIECLVIFLIFFCLFSDQTAPDWKLVIQCPCTAAFVWATFNNLEIQLLLLENKNALGEKL